MRQSRLLCMALFLCVGLTLLWGQRKPAHESPRPQGAVKVGTEEQHKAHVARVFDELFTNGRYEAVGQIYHPDCTVHTNNKNYRLNEAVSEGKGWRTAAPDLVMTADRMNVKGDMVTVSWTAKGTNTGHGNGLRATGKRILVRGESRFRMVDGKIAEVWNEYDQKDMFRQLGVSPTKAWLYDKFEDLKLAWNHTFSEEPVYASTGG